MKKNVRGWLFFLAIFFVCFFNVNRIQAEAYEKTVIQAGMIQTLYGGAGGRMSCEFDGYSSLSGRHEGIDFVKARGAAIYSLSSGVVVRASDSASSLVLSTLAIYDSANNKTVIYLHATNFKVSEGMKVEVGTELAEESDRKGGSPHTHVEVRNGKQTSASTSRDDPVLDNEDPYPYWALYYGKKVTINSDLPSLFVGEANSFLWSVTDGVDRSSVKWKAEPSGIVEVNNSGDVKAKAAGTAKVTAYVVDSSGKMVSSDSRTVTVKNPTIKLNYPSATIYGNEKLQLTAAVEGPSQTVEWKCSSPMYFSVNSKGQVGLGSKETLQTVSATITATANGVSATCTVTRKPGILEFSKSSCTLNAGSTSTLTAKAKGVNSVKYFSSNTAVATVDSKTGKVTAKKEGKAVITAKAGSITGSYTVNVKPALQLNKSSLILNQKKSAKLTATVKGSTKKVKWFSSNSKVVSVSSSGKVTAKKAGKATISVTLKSSSGNITKTCSVTVLKPSIKLNITKATLNVGKSITLKAAVKGASQNVTWKSSKKSVASVNSRGVITAKKKGTATIYATANGVTAKCKIVVKKGYTQKQAEKGLKKYVTKRESTNFYYFYEGKTGDEYTFWVTFRGVFTKRKYFVNAKTGEIYGTGIYFGVNEWRPSDPKRYLTNLSKYL